MKNSNNICNTTQFTKSDIKKKPITDYSNTENKLKSYRDSKEREIFIKKLLN